MGALGVQTLSVCWGLGVGGGGWWWWEDLSSKGQPARGGVGGMGEGTRGLPSSSLGQWDPQKLLSGRQRKLLPLASVWREQRPSGNTQLSGARPSSSWLLCQRGSEQRLSDASSNRLTHTALSTRPVKAGAGRAMAPCCPDQMTETSWLLPAGCV